MLERQSYLAMSCFAAFLKVVVQQVVETIAGLLLVVAIALNHDSEVHWWEATRNLSLRIVEIGWLVE